MTLFDIPNKRKYLWNVKCGEREKHEQRREVWILHGPRGGEITCRVFWRTAARPIERIRWD